MDKTGDFHLPWDERSAPVIPKHHCKTSVDIRNTAARQVWVLQRSDGRCRNCFIVSSLWPRPEEESSSSSTWSRSPTSRSTQPKTNWYVFHFLPIPSVLKVLPLFSIHHSIQNSHSHTHFPFHYIPSLSPFHNFHSFIPFLKMKTSY